MTLQQHQAPQAAPFSEQFVSRSIIPLLSKLGKTIFQNAPCLRHGFRFIFFLRSCTFMWSAQTAGGQIACHRSTERLPQQSSQLRLTVWVVLLKIHYTWRYLMTLFPELMKITVTFFEGNFQEVLKISIIRGTGFKCNIHHSFEWLVNPVCFLQYPHISLWK